MKKIEGNLKNCRKHGELNEENATKEKYKDRFRYRCNICKSEERSLRAVNKGAYECKKHGWLSPQEIRVKKKGGKEYLGCRICHRASAGTARNKDRTRANEWGRRDRALHPEKYRQWQKEYRERQGEEGKQKRHEEHVTGMYKITRERYYEMIKEQDNKCKICGGEETRKSSKSDKTLRLTLDHCHKKGKVRGLLCHNCNTGLGKFKDSTELLFRAVEYLDKFMDEK